MKRNYPDKGFITLDGGLNNKYEKSIIPDNESPDCLNVQFNNGSVGTRPGWVKLNTTAVGSFVGDGIYTRHDNSGAETMIVWAGGTAWQLATTTFSTIGSGQSVFTAGVRVGSAEQENYIYFGNGGSIPYKWSGSEFTRHGIYAPTTTMTVASTAAGPLTGDYRYKVTVVNSALVESDVSPATATFSAAGASLTVGSIPTFSASYGVASRRIYRTVAGGTAFLRLTEIADNTTTSYVDSIADSALGVTAPTDNGVPPKYSTIVYHQYRLFMNDPTNPNFVWYSNLNEPYVVASTNFFRHGDKNIDIVRSFAVFDNGLLVFGDKTVTVVYMPSTDPTDWQFVTSKSAYGSKSPYCMLNYNNKVLFPAVQNTKFAGFAAFSGNTTEATATSLSVLNAGSDLLSDRIEPDMFNVVEGYIQNISGMVYQNKCYIALTYGSGSTTNNRIYVMDFSISNLSKRQSEAWVPWTSTVVNPAQFTVYGGNLYTISSTATGYVYRLSTATYSDDGSAINSYFYTKEYSGYKQDQNNHKDFRFLNALIDMPGAYFMNIGYKTDSEVGDPTTIQVDVNSGGSLWGTAIFGTSVWGGGRYQQKQSIGLNTAKGERIQFYFSNQNTAGQRFKTHWMNFSYNVKGER